MPSVFKTIIEVQALRALLDDPSLVIIDARFNLMDVEEGRKAYVQAHIPGAQYTHLDDDLSGPPLTDAGRHPLPSSEAMNALFSRLGIDHETQVVAYDQRDSAVAARVWWMLRYMGHDAVAVLDGGWQAWGAAGLPTASGVDSRPARNFHGEPHRDWLITVDQVAAARRLVDARDPRRYRGEREPLDPKAGHIPGAVNHFYADNVDDEGRFLAPKTLAGRLSEALAGTPPQDAVYYCGSGVTACHDLLAACHAGLPPGGLYVGSWSEWCSDPERPIATGADPGTMQSE